MTNFMKLRNLYKLIIFIFIVCIVVKMKNQLTTLNSYKSEIATLNEKIAVLEEQIDVKKTNANNSRQNNENIARKDLRMYYPNETPYRGY